MSEQLKLPPIKEPEDLKRTATNLVERLSPWYQELGFTGFLAVMGSALSILTVVLSWNTVEGSDGQWYSGLTLQEEILFMIISISFLVIALAFTLSNNRMKARFEEKSLELDIEYRKALLLHKREISRLAMANDNPPLDESDSDKPGNGGLQLNDR